MPKMIRILFSSLHKTMEITPVFSTHSIRRKENLQNVIYQEQSKVFYHESNKMWTKKW